MAFINVAEWSPENVAQWLQGLEDCILPYVHFFLNNQINGCRLLLLSPDDLVKLNVTKIGHQEIILDGVDLLKHLHYNFNSETLQSLALRLGCKSRSLYNQLKQEQEELQTNSANPGSQALSGVQNAINKTGTLKKHNSSSHKNSVKNQVDNQSNTASTNSNRNKISTKTLFAVCDILNAAKTFISWIDRYPFDGQEVYVPIRKTILKLSIELASTAQRDQFVDRPNEIILTNCLTFAGLCDRIVQDLHDSLAIQPASLDVALIKKRSNEELGMHIHSSYSGIHIISGIKLSSATNNCGRIDEGDEIVQVNYRTVVGWQLRKLVDIMKEYQTELILTLKKRPKHSVTTGQISVVKPFKLPLQEYAHNQKDLSPMNGSMTLRSIKPRKPLPDEYANEYTNLGELNVSKLDAQMLNGSISRGKAAIRRRATISGSTSSVNTCGTVRVDDLMIKNHQSSTKIHSETIKLQKSDLASSQVTNNNSQNVPFAKVQPLQQSEEGSVKQATVPKQVTNNNSTFSVTSSSNGKTLLTIKSTNSCTNENVGIVLPNASRANEQQSLKLSTFQQQQTDNNSTLPQSVQNSSDNTSITPTLNNLTVESTTTSTNTTTTNKPAVPLRQRNSNSNSSNPTTNPTFNSLPPTGEKPAIPMRPNKLAVQPAEQPTIQVPQLNRFVTLKQIEEENAIFFKQNPNSPLCQLINNSNSSTNNNIDKSVVECNNLLSGWLYTKREHFNTLLNANAKWSSKYVQLSTNYMLYAFRNEHATKADLVINLAAFKVSPACECKSKENVFKTFNKHVIFLFASESQTQMRQWVDTLRQLMTNCATIKPELLRISNNSDVACYSETEDEEDVIDDEMMLQNFANELVETTSKQQEETIESKVDIIKTEVDKQKNSCENEESVKPIKLDDLQNSSAIKVENEALNEEDEDEKHNRRMMRLLNRRRQRYTSTNESVRDSSPSSTTSSASSTANTSAGQAVLSRFQAINELKERLQKQAQEKLEQRRLAIASGKKMYERSVSCMDASTISSFNSKLALNQANTTNNTPLKAGLIRTKSGSQQSLLSPTSKDTFDLSSDSNKPSRPVKPFYMTQQNKVLPTIPPRPPKPQSISIANTPTSNNEKAKSQNNTDELSKRSQQPQPQPRTSKNGALISVEDEQLADHLNKENINSNSNKTADESILKKTLQCDQKIISNHKDSEYISNIIDELYNFAEESKTEQVISKPIMQSNQQSIQKIDSSLLRQQSTLVNNMNDAYQTNNYNNQFINNPMNQLNDDQLHQLQTILFNKDSNGGLAELNDEDLDSFDEEECLDDEEFSDEEEEFECMNNKDYNIFNNTQNKSNFDQNLEGNNLFAFRGANHQMNENHINQVESSVDFLASGPNFLSAPGMAALSQNQNTNGNQSNLLNNHQMDNHLRNDLSSSSNSNNYPTSSSTNSFNISPYSSISQHNHPPSSETLPIQMDDTFNNPINHQLENRFEHSQDNNQNRLLTDEQLSDTSSGVSSYASAMLEAQTQQWFQKLEQDNQEQLANLTEEERQQFFDAFRAEFVNQLARQFQHIQMLAVQQQLQQNDPQAMQNLILYQQSMNAQGLNQMAVANNNVPFGLTGEMINQKQINFHHQATSNDLMHNDMNNLDDDEDVLTDSDLSCGMYDEEDTEDELEFEVDSSDKNSGRQKIGRKFSYLFGSKSPKLLKKISMKQQKRTTTGMVSSGDITDKTDAPISKNGIDASSVWISMGNNKMLDDEATNLVDQPSIDKKINDDDNKPKAALTLFEEPSEDCSTTRSCAKESSNATTNKKSVESNTSLNSSQSSFVQLKTSEGQSKEIKPTSPKSGTSLAIKWFGRKSDQQQNKQQSDKSTDKKFSAKNAPPQITQVIYKRKPSLPEIPIERKEKSKTVSIPDEESSDDNNIYAEISETQLVLEEMRRSLNKHTTERKIIELILQQPAINLQESK